MKKLFYFLSIALLAIGCNKVETPTAMEKNQEKINAIWTEFSEGITFEKYEEMYAAAKKLYDAFEAAPLPDDFEMRELRLELIADKDFGDFLSPIAGLAPANLKGKYTFDNDSNVWIYEELATGLMFVVDDVSLEFVRSGKHQVSTNNPMTICAVKTISIRNASGIVYKNTKNIESINLEELDYVSQEIVDIKGFVRTYNTRLSDDAFSFSLQVDADGKFITKRTVEFEHTMTSAILAAGVDSISEFISEAQMTNNFLNKLYVKMATPSVAEMNAAIANPESSSIDEMNKLFKMTWGYTPSAEDQGYSKIVFNNEAQKPEFVLVFNEDNSECHINDFLTVDGFQSTIDELKRIMAIVKPGGTN